MLSVPLRRVLGLCFLATTVFLWTASSFLASSIFADATFPKPYFINYVNVASFTLPLLPFFAQRLFKRTSRRRDDYARVPDADTDPNERDTSDEPESREALLDDRHTAQQGGERDGERAALARSSSPPPLTTRETLVLAAQFSMLWFLATYLNAASLQYTTVASCTILSSTSSVFILIIGSVFRVETFSMRKVVGVVASLIGVSLVAKADSASESSRHRGTFPYKSPGEIAVGDAMALFAALCYGVYGVTLVKRVGDESRIKMPLFFGFIGLVNIFCFWPGFALLHWLGVEKFELPPNGHVWAVVLLNAAASLVGDMCWAYAMLFLSPLVVTVGLSLTIPLSLVGQIALNSNWESPVYFIGAVIVLLSFLFINYESSVSPPPSQDEHLTT